MLGPRTQTEELSETAGRCLDLAQRVTDVDAAETLRRIAADMELAITMICGSTAAQEWRLD